MGSVRIFEIHLSRSYPKLSLPPTMSTLWFPLTQAASVIHFNYNLIYEIIDVYCVQFSVFYHNMLDVFQ